MKQFKVTTSCPATEYWTFLVEAETEEKAGELVLSGSIDPADYYVYGHDNETQVVDEVEEITEDL